MKLQKYFGFISYNGKAFYGSQTQNIKLYNGKVYDTVQETLTVHIYINFILENNT
jgi:tRNA U38,U39,U40 pseudouridine synthase TruA